MNIAETFKNFISNLKIKEDKANDISYRYGRITKSLNEKFRDNDSKTSNRLQVGSYGRYTGIKTISDLDMLYIMPNSKWDIYNVNNGQKKLLIDTKKAIEKTYPTLKISVDRCVVTVKFNDSHIDVQPVFEIEDGFKYPETYGDGNWKITKPRKEIAAMREFSKTRNNNLRDLCRMTRAWKNKHGTLMGGLLIDTLAYNFLKNNDHFDTSSFSNFDILCRDFFEYLAAQPKDQKEYGALGSNQRVKVRKSFIRKAKKAYKLSVEAIDAKTDKKKHQKWRDIFGDDFPKYVNDEIEAKNLNINFNNTEQFIEDLYPIEIQYELKINCEIKQKGFREGTLREFLKRNIALKRNKSLKFYIENIEVPKPYSIMWKVTNRGEEAIKRNCVRGAIIDGSLDGIQKESTDFKGEHFVECYIIKNGVVVAIDRIDVPISI